MKKALYYTVALGLQKHPEGGYFKEVYRSKDIIPKNALPVSFTGDRNIATSIYYMLVNTDKSHFHKIKSDESWHFYAGNTVQIIAIGPGGALFKFLLGNDIARGEHFQVTIPAGWWFGASLVSTEESYALMGCTVAPGFDFADFEMAKRETLLELFPQHKAIIEFYT